jgi:uncharacterized OB-fold protein
MTEKNSEEKELLAVTSGEAFQPFDWSVGKYGSKFLAEVRDNKKFYGVKCPKCSRVYVPPRKVCGRCFVAMDDLVEVKTEGEIVVCAIIEFGFVDPSTGIKRPVPYGYVFVKLDGADTLFPHFLDNTDPEKVKVGARVKAVFEEKRTGSIMDLKHFTLVE